jgi:hypothetical protein
MTTAKLGIAVRDLGGSELNWRLIRGANVAAERGLDVTMFYQDLVPPCLSPNFAVMPLVEAWGYDGLMVATTLATAKKMVSFPRVASRLFYVWDLEWLRMPNRQFHVLDAVYNGATLVLAARCEEHRRVIEDAWGRSVDFVVPDADIISLLNAATEYHEYATPF